jgi:GT2 family glycosyltransferase
MDKISVIVVTYNAMKWARKCFDSLLNSSITTQIIVVDNLSTDGTQQFIRDNYPEIILLPQSNNSGFGYANNIGISSALKNGAEYFFLLNQDAWVETDTIEDLRHSIEENDEYGIISPVHLNGSHTALDFNFSKYAGPENCPGFYSDLYLLGVQNRIYETSFVNAAAWMISRKCIEAVGGFCPLFSHYGEDLNYVHRVKYHGSKIGILATSTICHDRADRSSNFLKDDKLLKFERRIKLKLCNPNEKKEKIIKSLIIELLATFLTLSFSSSKLIFRKLRIANKMVESCSNVLETTKQRQMTYLK